MSYRRGQDRTGGQTGHSAPVSANLLLCDSKLNDIERWMQQVQIETQGPRDLNVSGQNTLAVPCSNQAVKANRLSLPSLRRRSSSTSFSSSGAPDDGSNPSGDRRSSSSLTDDNAVAHVLSTSPKLSRPQSTGNTFLSPSNSDASLSCQASEFEEIIDIPSPGNSARTSRSTSPIHTFQSNRRQVSPSRLPVLKPEILIQRASSSSPLPDDTFPEKRFADSVTMNERNISHSKDVQMGARHIHLCSSSGDACIPSIVLTPTSDV